MQLHHVIDRVEDTTQKLKARAEQTRELVAAINAAAADINVSRAKK